MKIAMIGSKGIPARSGGVERHVEAVTTRLAKAGHEVFVYTRPWYTHSKDKLKAKSYKLRGLQLIPLPSIRSKYFDAITHTLLASFDVLRRDVDVVHYHGIGPALLLWIPKFFSRVVRPHAPLAVVVTFHCQDYHHQKWNWFARLMLRAGEWMACTMADETIVVSHELEHYVWTAYQRRAVYVPNGVDEKNQKSKIKSHKALRSVKLKSNEYLLFVGRLVRHKGIHTLIEAYRKLQTSLPLVIVGAGSKTPDYERELRTLAKGLPIRFLGEQHGDALASLVSNARLIVHPSVSEGMSLFLLEAMASGRPVLASDIPENREVLQRSATTFLADDVDDLRKKLFWCLAHPAVMARRAAQSKRISRDYSWQRASDDLSRVYDHALWITCSNITKLQQKWAR